MKWNGEKLKQLRLKNNMSIEDLAYEYRKYYDKVTRQTISNWENNVTIPNVLNAFILAQIFGVDVNYFMEEEK